MAVSESVELKFRLYDGTDIGPNKYAPATTVASLKERLLAQWPAGNENAPKTINDMKLINAGKILENSKTLADARVVPIGECPGSIITMHIVVRPTLTDKNSGSNSKSFRFLPTHHCSCCFNNNVQTPDNVINKA